jgi:energy-coupling factor transporter ATP-binding protein EcfA2
MSNQNIIFDYNKAILWMETKGKELYGKNFILQDSDYKIIYQLIAYFIKDEKVANKLGIHLDKGILLSGPIGVGKTAMLNTLRFLLKPEERYIMKPCRDISFEFMEEGYNIIHKYSRGLSRQYEAKHICFDDLGVEGSLKYFGNECNVMAEILLSRYDLFVSQKIMTHITTNLTASEIENLYGNRVRSRLREMLNLISFDKSTEDKRR